MINCVKIFKTLYPCQEQLSLSQASIYLDHAATSPITDDLMNQYINYLKEYSYNSNTVYGPGLKTKQQLEKVRQNFASILKVDKNDLIFTSGGTESNNMAIHCITKSLKSNRVIWYSTTAHPSLLNPVLNLDERWEKIALPINRAGTIDYDSLENLNTPDVIVLEWVNSETGFIQDISKLQNFILEKKIDCSLIVDGVQGMSKLDMIKLNKVTAFTFSGHKCGSPVGTGCLYLKNIKKYSAMLHGGGQENGMRSGTNSVPLIMSFWDAFDKNHKALSNKKQLDWSISKPSALRHESNQYSPYIYILDTSPVEGEVLLHHLEEKGIFVGLGSACSASKKKVSNTHKAIGLTEQQSRCTIRISFNPFTSQNTLHKAQQTITEVWESLNRFFS